MNKIKSGRQLCAQSQTLCFHPRSFLFSFPCEVIQLETKLSSYFVIVTKALGFYLRLKVSSGSLPLPRWCFFLLNQTWGIQVISVSTFVSWCDSFCRWPWIRVFFFPAFSHNGNISNPSMPSLCPAQSPISSISQLFYWLSSIDSHTVNLSKLLTINHQIHIIPSAARQQKNDIDHQLAALCSHPLLWLTHVNYTKRLGSSARVSRPHWAVSLWG